MGPNGMAELDGIDALLVDLDGVLYIEDEAIDGAAAALATLREADLGLRFGTNTTTRSRRQTLQKLELLGFELADEELITPAVLARRRCSDRGHQRVALVMDEGIKEDFEGLEAVDESPDAVIIGDLGDSFGFEILNRAFRMVADGAELIALQKNRFWRTADGLTLDAGPFVAAIEYASGEEAEVVGKPSASFFELVLDSLGASAGNVAMVGDDIETDIGGALDAGLSAVLVRTGKYREEFVSRSGIEPTHTIDSFADVPGLLGVG